MVEIEDLDNNKRHDGESRSQNNCISSCSNAIQHALEWIFYRLGFLVASYPIPTIAICLVAVALLGSGLKDLDEEPHPENLFVPENSQAYKDKEWVEKHFPGNWRTESAILIDSNDILQPATIKQMLSLDKAVKAIKGWQDLCKRIGPYCWSNSILELWSFDETIINGLSQSDIVTAVNDVMISPVTGSPFEITNYLSDITRDSNGKIQSAKVSYMSWILENNSTSFFADSELERVLAWEDLFLELMAKTKADLPDSKQLSYYAWKSWDAVTSNAIRVDMKLVIAGYVLIIIFVCLVLGYFDRIRQRMYLSLGGVLCVVCAVISSFGLASYLGWSYGNLHGLLPFLILGLGVDDMFVIVHCYQNLALRYKEAPLPEKMAAAMQHAGVAVTITSATDIVAFGIGATTVLPGLRSFCVYATIAIFISYLLQCTLFVALLTLDERRVAAGRDACCCCYRPRDVVMDECSRTNLVQSVFGRFIGPSLMRLPVKLAVLILTVALLATSIFGLVRLQQDFDIHWFLPSNSYAHDYLEVQEKYFKSSGMATVTMYTGELEYYKKLSRLVSLCREIEEDAYTADGSVDCWPVAFQQWLSNTTASTVLTENDFVTKLHTFLATDSGLRFSSNTFNFQVVSGKEVLLASKIRFRHKDLDNAAEEIAAMQSIREVAQETGFEHDQCFPYSFFYLFFEGNKVIKLELFRNVGLALLAVGVMTFILLTDFWVCLLVLLCVVFTLVDVAGMLYFWGLTIDIVTSITLIMSVGLAVDYSAHIGYTFLRESGGRKARVCGALTRIGPAVLFGGFSTFLAFLPLAASSLYFFKAFFKVFLCVSIFGLFHGLIFLPVLLSWIGPKPYPVYEQGQPGVRDTQPNMKLKRAAAAAAQRSTSVLTEQQQNGNVPRYGEQLSSSGDGASELEAEMRARSQLGVDRGPLPEPPREEAERPAPRHRRSFERPPPQPRPEWLRIYEDGNDGPRSNGMFVPNERSGHGNYRRNPKKKKVPTATLH